MNTESKTVISNTTNRDIKKSYTNLPSEVERRMKRVIKEMTASHIYCNE